MWGICELGIEKTPMIYTYKRKDNIKFASFAFPVLFPKDK